MNKSTFDELKQGWWEEKKDIEFFSVGGEPVKFNPSQAKFFNDRESRSLLISGGYRSGKTDVLLRKAVLLSLIFPKNEGLLGRRTATELEVSTLPHLEEICDPKLWTYHPKQMLINFFNGSKIYLRGLDVLQAGEVETKKAVAFIRGLNLGWWGIDQAEAVEKVIVDHLEARLSRNTVPFRQGMLTSNPTNFWAFDDYKKKPKKGYRLIEVSMMENEANLPPEYVEEMKEKQLTDPKYYDQYVLGRWDEYMTAENNVFEDTHLSKLALQVREPRREWEGFKIYKEPDDMHVYQIGADPSEGKNDAASISVVDCMTGEEVAKYAKTVLYDIAATAVENICKLYKVKRIIPEGNNFAFIMELNKKVLPPLYYQRVFDVRDRKEKKNVGFRMTRDGKELLVENVKRLIRTGKSTIYDKETVDEFHSFVYHRNAGSMGAREGAHDDRVIATLLAYMDVDPENPGNSFHPMNPKKLEEYSIYGEQNFT